MGDESIGGRVLLDLIPALALETCVQWRALLAHELAARQLAPTDGARLEFLIALVFDHQGTVSSTTYETTRASHAPSAPHHSTLVRAFGSWTAVLGAAERLLGPAKCETVGALVEDRLSVRPRPRPRRDRVLPGRPRRLADLQRVLGVAQSRKRGAKADRGGGSPYASPRVAQLRFGEWAIAVRLASQWRTGSPPPAHLP